MLGAKESRMAIPPKVCPRCGEEYLHTAIECVHCQIALVHHDQVGEIPVEELPPPSELRRIRAAGAAWVVSLSEQLTEREIPHRVEPLNDAEADAQGGGAGPYGVYVRDEDFEAAKAIDTAYLKREMPDLDESQLEEALAGDDDDGCPACGDPVAPDAVECAGCGLALGPIE
jgi:hypothetical protein